MAPISNPAGPASTSCARRTAWWRCMATGGAGHGAGPEGWPHDHGPPLRSRGAGGEPAERQPTYAQQLRDEGAVIASFAERRAELLRQLTKPRPRQGLKPIEDEALLDEVTALVERPTVLLCRFEPEFLAVPQECLILTMKANQKYFPLLDAQGRLTDRFLIVSNINPADPSRVIQGNERVVRPRLADAKFFFDQDRKKTLEAACRSSTRWSTTASWAARASA
jgi:hypothetical protein